MLSSPMVLSVLLLASLTALLLLAPRLSPPPAPVAAASKEEVQLGGAGRAGFRGEAEADDLALFRRATLDAGDGAVASPPKVAFLFLTNSDLTFAPLWERFFAGHEGRHSVYVHADPVAQLRLQPTPSFRGRFVAARPAQRGDPSLITAVLLDDAYFALLSVLHARPAPRRPRRPPTVSRAGFCRPDAAEPVAPRRRRARRPDVDATAPRAPACRRLARRRSRRDLLFRTPRRRRPALGPMRHSPRRPVLGPGRDAALLPFSVGEGLDGREEKQGVSASFAVTRNTRRIRKICLTSAQVSSIFEL